MSILARSASIISANINALLDKCEDPAKMTDKYLRDIMEDLADVKKETASIMAEEKRAEKALYENADEIVKFSKLAKKALKAGNEDDAKAFLAKKQDLEASEASLKTVYAVAHENAVKMRDMHDKLTRDAESLEARRAAVKAKVAVARTQEKINEIGETISRSGKSQSVFDSMEAKADMMLDTANAEAELNTAEVNTTESLEKKYSSSTSVDDELAKMKTELGL